jgi:hypothetical protein
MHARGIEPDEEWFVSLLRPVHEIGGEDWGSLLTPVGRRSNSGPMRPGAALVPASFPRL